MSGHETSPRLTSVPKTMREVPGRPVRQMPIAAAQREQERQRRARESDGRQIERDRRRQREQPMQRHGGGEHADREQRDAARPARKERRAQGRRRPHAARGPSSCAA